MIIDLDANVLETEFVQPEDIEVTVLPKGPKGDKGDKGDTGEQGIQGPKGDKGDTGEQGIQGPKGDKGDTGEQGIQGPKGDKATINGVNTLTIQEGQNISISQSGNIMTISGINVPYKKIVANNNDDIALDELDVGYYQLIDQYNKPKSTLKYKKTSSSIGNYTLSGVINGVFQIIKDVSTASNGETILYAETYYDPFNSNTKGYYTASVYISSGDNLSVSTGGKIAKISTLDDNQTIIAKKTFNVLPESSLTPTTDNQLTNKKYVDDSIASVSDYTDLTNKPSINGITLSGDKSANDLNLPFKKVVLGNSDTVIFEDLDVGVYQFINQYSIPRSTIYFKLNSTSGEYYVEGVINGLVYIVQKPSTAGNGVTFAYIETYINAFSTSDYGYYYVNFYRTNNNLNKSGGNKLSKIMTLGDAQTITAKKTFSVLPESSVTPTSNNQLVNKKYVDDSIASSGSDFDINIIQGDSITLDGLKKGIYYCMNVNGVIKIRYTENDSYTTYSSLSALYVCKDADENLQSGEYFASMAFLGGSSQQRQVCRIYFFKNNSGYSGSIEIASMYLTTAQNQTITGVKTFNSLPVSSVIPSTDTQLVNKKYVDDSIVSAITDALGGSY